MSIALAKSARSLPSQSSDLRCSVVEAQVLRTACQSICSQTRQPRQSGFTMVELAEKVVKMTGSSSQIVFQDLPQDDPKQRRPDISLAKERLDWEPSVALDQGLGWTVDYFKKLLSDMARS